ncbi:MAG: hypothetical protein KW802_01195 [Candidatus Doudnabacteria bacterium]|nr:hypothetical protein [Candidatus Doudnabacteria bacterium]
MARLETQINQIYLTSKELKKTSLILYEEQLNTSLQLFMVAELWNIQKKSEETDLKKISEIILSSLRSNKKLPAEALFETSLSQINQNLADLAHAGRKSWVGKFSCLICLKGLDNNIYLANNGQTSAWLKRRSELMEVLSAEKRGTHPLKTFINFTQGKLTDDDSLVLTTSNIFNYISFELFSKILDQHDLEKASAEISKILQDSVSPDVAFSSFLLHFTKKPLEEMVESRPQIESEIYAPLPEEIEQQEVKPKWRFPVPRFPVFAIGLPKLNFAWLKKFHLPYFQKLSKAGKFFFISFAVFLLLFLINLGIYAAKLHGKKTQSRIEQLMQKVSDDVARTQSALIYKDETDAVTELNQTLADFQELQKLDPASAASLNAKVEQAKTIVNKINTVYEPKVFAELKRHPSYLAPAGTNSFLLANEDSNSLSLLTSSSLSDYFLLNSLKSPISSIAFSAQTGAVVLTKDELYRVDQNLKQFEPLVALENNARRMKAANNALYILNDNGIAKVNYAKSNYQATSLVTGNLATARDLAVDKDIYLLYPDKLIRYVSGQPQSFNMPNMSEPMTNADKIFVGSNIYILEANKKRLISMTKTGALINQIYFPTTSNLTDFYIDEAARNIFLLDDNKLYKVTL